MPARTKVAVACEILASYVPALRTLRSNDVVHMLASARDVAPIVDPPDVGQHRDLAIRLGWFVVRVLAVMPTDSRCLARALVLARMLARRSIAAELVIGVRSGDQFQAHAWLEHDGRPVLPAGDFEPIFRG